MPCHVCPLYRNNPAWTNHALFVQWDRILQFAGASRMPKITGRTARKLTAVEYGVGHYGAVLPTETPGLVVKITSDPTEAKFVSVLLGGAGTGGAGLRQFSGMIPYHAVFKLKGARQKRPIFIIWRDEAFDIGTWAHDPSAQRFVNILYAYYLFAVGLGRSGFWGTKSLAKRTLVRRNAMVAYDKFRGDTAAKALARFVQLVRRPGWSTDRTKKVLDPQIEALNGSKRAAFCVEGIRLTVKTMASDPTGRAIGKTLSALFKDGVVLADLHTNNIGRNAGKKLVITDPGHAIFLSDRFDDVKALSIERAKPGDWRRSGSRSG